MSGKVGIFAERIISIINKLLSNNKTLMKKYLLALCVLFIQFGMVSGQGLVKTALATDGDDGIVNGLIRTWTTTKALSYHVHNNKNVFSIIDSASSTVRSVIVPDFYRINDFRIVGDTAYCGGSSHDTAILAFFNIQDILLGSPISFEVSNIKGLREVTKLVAYRNSKKKGVCVAAIGMELVKIENADSTYTYWNKYHMIECTNYGGSPFSVTTRECDFTPDYSEWSEIPTDVIKSDKYVAFVGLLSNWNGMFIRKGDVNGIFSNNMIDTIHQFGVPTQAITSLPLAENIKYDTIAVATAHEEYSGAYSAQIRLFYLPNMDMCYAQRMQLAEKGDIKDLVYMRRHRTLLMVESTLLGDYIVYARPNLLSSYSTSAIGLMSPAYNNEIIMSLDRHNADYYIFTTSKHWVLHRMSSSILADFCINKQSRIFDSWDITIDIPKYHKREYEFFHFESRALNPTNFNRSIDCITHLPQK